jgi:hypothetical protein
MSLRRCQVGVSISSRYCSFCAAARWGDLIEKIAGVTRIGAAELREGSEEMVMPSYALGRDEAAHGEGID